MIPTGRKVTVAVALLHVVIPQQEELLVTVVPHPFIPLTISEKHVRSVNFYFFFFEDVVHVFQVSPYTVASAGFRYEANKGRVVSPEITQALTEQQ